MPFCITSFFRFSQPQKAEFWIVTLILGGNTSSEINSHPLKAFSPISTTDIGTFTLIKANFLSYLGIIVLVIVVIVLILLIIRAINLRKRRRRRRNIF